MVIKYRSIPEAITYHQKEYPGVINLVGEYFHHRNVGDLVIEKIISYAIKNYLTYQEEYFSGISSLRELAIYGCRDTFIDIDPSKTFFAKTYRRHTNFSISKHNTDNNQYN